MAEAAVEGFSKIYYINRVINLFIATSICY
jgi:hypothetical protein